jgi:chemotaxis protein MotB
MNDTPENKARNRRTRIVVLPKIDQFYDMIEKEMKNKTIIFLYIQK